MATFSETFLCTALPQSISGTEVLIAVLISPRLGSDSTTEAPLDNWPDVRDWPSIQPSWKVTITQGGKTVGPLDATEVSGPYDRDSWGLLFPKEMMNTPYQPNDQSTTPIFSYPVAKVRDAVRDLHVQAMTSSRTDFPTVEALQAMPHFADLKKAADPAFVADVVRSQSKDPVADASASIAQAIAMGEAGQGARPGSDPPPDRRPTVTRVQSIKGNPPTVGPAEGSPAGGTEVIITGTNFAVVTGNTVMFGDQAATNIRVNVPEGTEIRCVSPAAATPTLKNCETREVDVTVTTENGTSEVTAQSKFNYVQTCVK